MDKGTSPGGGARGEDYAGPEVHERLRAERGLELGVQEAEMAKLWSHTESTEITERVIAHTDLTDLTDVFGVATLKILRKS